MKKIMAKRYVNVKKTGCVLDVTIPEAKPENIIYFAHWFDRWYDHESENMGYFLEMIYVDGDEVKAKWCNPGDWDKIGALIEEVGDKFAKHEEGGGYVYYLNKEMLSDIKIKGSFLIYKDKYRVDLKS